MLHRTKIFKFKTTYTELAPDGKTPAKAIQIRFLKDPFGLFKQAEQLKLAQLDFTSLMLNNFSEVTISFFENGFRVELLPHQNADAVTVDTCGIQVEKFVSRLVEAACARLDLFKNKKFVADSDASGSVTCVSIVEEI
jgi:hypothetical protein